MALQKVVRNMLSTGVSDSSDATAITIDSSENVGIGTTSPSTKLHVGSGSDSSENLTIQSSDDKRLVFKGASATRADIGVYESNHNDLVIRAGASAGILLITNNSNFNGATNPVKIDTSGNVGIGLTNQANKLQVDGDICIGKATTSADLKSTLKMRGANGSNELQVFDLINDGENGRVDFAYNRAGSSAQTIMTFGATVGNVGIGTTSPSRIFDVENSSANALCSIVTGTALKAGFLFGDTSADDQGGIVYENNGDYLYFRTGGAERLRVLNGGGLTFNGDSAAANALDDYEEGTWTPTVNAGVIASAGGHYTKIGRVVTVSYYYNLTTLGSSTTTVQIGGLPFTAKTTSGNGHQSVGSILCRYFTKNQIVSYIGDNASYLQYYNNTSTDFDAITFGEIEATYDNDFAAHGTHTYITS